MSEALVVSQRALAARELDGAMMKHVFIMRSAFGRYQEALRHGQLTPNLKKSLELRIENASQEVERAARAYMLKIWAIDSDEAGVI